MKKLYISLLVLLLILPLCEDKGEISGYSMDDSNRGYEYTDY